MNYLLLGLHVLYQFGLLRAGTPSSYLRVVGTVTACLAVFVAAAAVLLICRRREPTLTWRQR